MIRKITSFVLITSLFVFVSGILQVKYVSAASLSGISDTMSNQTASANSSHVIKFTVATTMTSGQTITVTFPSDFDLTSEAFGNVTITHGSSTGLEHGSGVDETVASNNDANTVWGAAFSTTNNRVLTMTAPTSWSNPISGSDKVIITIASVHAVNSTTTGSKAITLATSSDSGSVAIPIVSGAGSDNVVITASVDPTITFSNDDASIGFGTLKTSGARYATTDTLGSDADTVANTMTISTNGPSGYTLTYDGPTLTGTPSGTILPAIITSDADGTPGQSQFALDGLMSTTETGQMATGYDHATPDWKFVASTPSALASATGPTTSDSIAMHYLANISAITPAGSYTTTVTFTATGNF